jgi:RNA polymerase-binding transcription factor DksA
MRKKEVSKKRESWPREADRSDVCNSILDRLRTEERELSLMVAAAETLPFGEVIDQWQVCNSQGYQRGLRNRIKQLRGAITRVQLGNFGSCIECGLKLDPKRLEVDLAITHCLVCRVFIEDEN